MTNVVVAGLLAVMLFACARTDAAQLWDYTTNPVVAADPDAPLTWETRAQDAFDGWGGSVRPKGISRCWFRSGTPSASAPFVCTIDYRTPVAVSKFVNYFHTPDDQDYRFVDVLGGPLPIRSIRIYRSANGASWSLAESFANQPDDFPQVLPISEPAASRYYKLEITGVEGGYVGLRSYEIETYTGPVIREKSVITSEPRVGEPCEIMVRVCGAGSYLGMTARVLASPDYAILASDVAVSSSGEAVVQVKLLKPGKLSVSLELRQSGQKIDADALTLTAVNRIILTSVQVLADGVHGTATNSGVRALAPTLTWEGQSVFLGSIAPGDSASFLIPGTPVATGLASALIRVDEEADAGFFYRKAYTLAGGPVEGRLLHPSLAAGWRLAPGQVAWSFTPAGTTGSVSASLRARLNNTDVSLKTVESASDFVLLRADTSVGILDVQMVPHGSSVKLTYNLAPSGVDTGVPPPYVLEVALSVSFPTFRFVPGWVYSATAQPNLYLSTQCPTRMMALSKGSNTLALVPSSDRSQMTLQTSAVVMQQLIGPNPVTVYVAATGGDWFESFRAVVRDVYQFTEPMQFKPVTDIVNAQMNYLATEPSIWSPTYQTVRSFPNSDCFFNFYGTPYMVPALLNKSRSHNDTAARQRVDGMVNWLRTGAIRSTNPGTPGALYSQFIHGHGPCDQAHNFWIQPHASGAGAWAMLYYYNATGRSNDAVLAAARQTLDWLVSVQNVSGGWYYAYLPNGTAVTDQEDAGNIWNIWALYRMWRLTGEQKYLDAANRGKDWFAAVWVPARMGRGYWEDGSGAGGQVGLSAEAYEFPIATRVFAEMGDAELALECARIAVTWIWTRTIDSRDYFNSYGHAHEQLGWPPATYVAPMFGVAAHIAWGLSGDPFYSAFAGAPKTIGWWNDEATGASVWPVEGTWFCYLEGLLTRQFWVDWDTGQKASICHEWLVREVNRRCPGLIDVDPETLSGNVLGATGSVYMKPGAHTIAPGSHHQVNWMGYRIDSGYALAITNHGDATEVSASVSLSALGLSQVSTHIIVASDGAGWQIIRPGASTAVNVAIPAGGTAVVAWLPGAVSVVSGCVRDSVTQQPIAGAEVTCNGRASCIADSSGRYGLVGLFPARALVAAAFPGREPCAKMVDLPAGGEGACSFHLTALPAGAVCDTFSRIDSVPLRATEDARRLAWQKGQGAPGKDAIIGSHRLSLPWPGTTTYYGAALDGFQCADFDATFHMTMIGSHQDQWGGIIYRSNGKGVFDQTRGFVLHAAPGGRLYLWRNGQHVAAVTNQAWNWSAEHEFRVRVVGESHRVWVDGQLAINITDAFNTTPGYFSLMRCLGAASFDNLVITPLAYPSEMTIAQAKELPDDALVRIDAGVVTGRYSDCFYIEDPARTAGMKVLSMVPVSVGDRVIAAGEIGTSAGERFVRPLLAGDVAVIAYSPEANGM